MSTGGGRPVITAERAFAHADALIAKHPGLTLKHIARLGGFSDSIWARARRSNRIEPATEERILAVRSRHILLSPPPSVPASLPRQRIEWLMEKTGATPNVIARATGLTTQTIMNVLDPDRASAQWRIYALLVACTVEDVLDADLWTAARKTMVRARAMQANGWALDAYDTMHGTNLTGAANLDPDARLAKTREAEVLALYETIGDTWGGSERAAAYARRLGFRPPVYYVDDMRLIETSVEERRQEKARMDLCILGLTIENRQIDDIVETLGVGDKRVSRVRRRHGIVIERSWGGEYVAAESVEGAMRRIRQAVKRIHYRSTIDLLDEPGIDYVDLLASVAPADAATLRTSA